jgi:hypothetical protein
MGMAYDPADGQVVLFGGALSDTRLGDTWVWDGTDWTVPRPWIELVPSSGPPGTRVQVDGRGFGAYEKVKLTFVDSITGATRLGRVRTDATAAFSTLVTIPVTATLGKQKVKAFGSGQVAKRTFTVT